MAQDEPAAEMLVTAPVPEADGTSRSYPLAMITRVGHSVVISLAAGARLSLRHEVAGDVATITIVATRGG